MNRLFEILYLLSDKRQMTTKELAEHFEVSTRTIMRDVDTLSMAGIPLYSSRGRNGGIALLSGFVFDKGMLSRQEQQQVVAALESLHAVTFGEAKETLRKLRSLFGIEKREWVAVDLSDWSNRHQELYETVKQAVLGNCVLEFDYYSRYGEVTSRRAEPQQLLFKGNTWYLCAYCLAREDFRFFKLSRMKRARLTETHFEPKAWEQEEYQESDIMQRGGGEEHGGNLPAKPIVMIISPEMGFQIYDSFSESEIKKQPDGSFLITAAYPEDEWVYSMILSYGCYAKVISPEHIQKEVKKRLLKAIHQYDG